MEPRKATEILLEILTKLDQVIAFQKTQDLNIKIVSNKLNSLIMELERTPDGAEFKMNPTVEVPQLEFLPLPLPIEQSPLGFRRTSRPETYTTEQQRNQTVRTGPRAEAADTAPKPRPVPVSSPQLALPKPAPADDWKTISMPNMQSEEAGSAGKVAVSQRLVDKNNKVIFLASVEIINKQTNEVALKTRTNSLGKWQAVLSPGIYSVNIAKSESMSKEKVQMNQEIRIDGKNSTQELPMVIAK